MTTGTIKRLLSDKGFGFIGTADGREFFFHSSAVRTGRFDALAEGQGVTFDEAASPKGPRAENVRVDE